MLHHRHFLRVAVNVPYPNRKALGREYHKAPRRLSGLAGLADPAQFPRKQQLVKKMAKRNKYSY
jgi:hypothetical protein